MNLKFNFTDSFYQNIDCLQTRLMFTSILHQRSKAYQERYIENLFPLAIEDFICQHISVENIKTKQILGSFKYINLRTCKQFNIQFPLVSTLKESQSFEQLYQVQKRMKEIEEQQKNLAYIGALNVNPLVKNDPKIRRKVKDMLAAGIVYCSNQDHADCILVTGTIPNGSHLFINWLGFQQFSSEPVTVSSVGQTSAYVMEWESWSNAALKNAKRFATEWEHVAHTKTKDWTVEENATENRTA